MSKIKAGFAPDRDRADDEITISTDGFVVFGAESEHKVPRAAYMAAKAMVEDRARFVQESEFHPGELRIGVTRARKAAKYHLQKFALRVMDHFDEGKIVAPEPGNWQGSQFGSALERAAYWLALADHLELVEQEQREQEEQRAKDEFIQRHQPIVDVLRSQANPPLFSEWVKTAGEGASFERYLVENEDAIRTAIARHRAAEAARVRLRAALAEAETARQRLKSEYNIDVEPLERVEVPEAPPGVAEFVQELQRHLVEH